MIYIFGLQSSCQGSEAFGDILRVPKCNFNIWIQERHKLWVSWWKGMYFIEAPQTPFVSFRTCLVLK